MAFLWCGPVHSLLALGSISHSSHLPRLCISWAWGGKAELVASGEQEEGRSQAFPQPLTPGSTASGSESASRVPWCWLVSGACHPSCALVTAHFSVPLTSRWTAWPPCSADRRANFTSFVPFMVPQVVSSPAGPWPVKACQTQIPCLVLIEPQSCPRPPATWIGLHVLIVPPPENISEAPPSPLLLLSPDHQPLPPSSPCRLLPQQHPRPLPPMLSESNSSPFSVLVTLLVFCDSDVAVPHASFSLELSACPEHFPVHFSLGVLSSRLPTMPQTGLQFSLRAQCRDAPSSGIPLEL